MKKIISLFLVFFVISFSVHGADNTHIETKHVNNDCYICDHLDFDLQNDGSTSNQNI